MFSKSEIDKLLYRLYQPSEHLLYENNVSRKRYNLQQKGHDILGVAHVDYVSSAWAYPIHKKNRVTCGQVDDRVGVWLLLDILPQYLDFDVLLTTDEEIGQSTAQDVTEPIIYNWTFQFDRRGTDVVDYDLASHDFKEKFEEESGILFGQGSFSDICFLDESTGSKINVGTGYYGEHKKSAYVNLLECYNQVQKFLKFAKKYKDTYFEQPEPTYYTPNFTYVKSKVGFNLPEKSLLLDEDEVPGYCKFLDDYDA